MDTDDSKSNLIQFYSEDTDFILEEVQRLTAAILEVVKKEALTIEAISYIFCSDSYLLEMNKKHLNHDYYTDVISFPYSTDPIEGDIFISVDRVRENAKNLSVDFIQELHRVMLHGLLHFIGYGDKTEEETLIMRAKENEYLLLLK